MPNIFSVPDKERNYRGFMVFTLAVIWLTVTAAIVSMGFVLRPDVSLRWFVLIGLSIFISVTTLTLNGLGYTRMASWSFTIMLWLYITLSCYTAGGIMAPGILMQISVILTAGFLLNRAGGLFFGLLTIGADFVLVYLELTGRLPAPSIIHTPVTRWIANIISFGTVISLQYYATHHLRTALTAMEREMQKREEAEKIKDGTLYNLTERIKELKTLYAVSKILQNEEAPYATLINKIIEILPSGWQYPDITAARINIAGNEYATHNFHSSQYSQQAEMKTASGAKVVIEVVYLQPMPAMDEGPFLKEERNLINMLVEMLKVDLERREREAEVKEQAETFKAIIENTKESIYLISPEFKILQFNTTAIEKMRLIRGMELQIGADFRDYLFPEYVDTFYSMFKDSLKGLYRSEELKTKGVTNHYFWIETKTSPVYDLGGELIGIRFLNESIDDRKQAEAVLRESEEKFRSIVEQSLVGIFIVRNDRFVYVNPGFEKIFGYSKKEFLKRMSFKELVYEDDVELAQNVFNKQINLHNANPQYNFRGIRNDGTIVYLEVIASLITYHDEQAVIGTLLDISDRIEEERKINQAVLDAQEKERLQIGMELHDNVKQILAGSGVFLEIAKKNVDDKDAVTAILDEVKKYNSHAMDELRKLSHRLIPAVEENTSLRQKIEWLILSLNLDKNLSVSTNIEDFQEKIDNRIQLNFYRVLQEQLTNVIQHAAAADVEINIRQVNNFIHLQVKDNGKGFDISERKEGIGLENIRRRMQILNGKVEIISSPGSGCEVNIQVPLTSL